MVSVVLLEYYNNTTWQFIIMNPDIAPGETNIQMTWETNPPADMDLFVAAIRTSDDDICLISFDNTNCESASKIRSHFLYQSDQVC